MLGNAVINDACPGAPTSAPTCWNTRLNPCRHNVPSTKVMSSGISARTAILLLVTGSSNGSFAVVATVSVVMIILFSSMKSMDAVL